MYALPNLGAATRAASEGDARTHAGTRSGAARGSGEPAVRGRVPARRGGPGRVRRARARVLAAARPRVRRRLRPRRRGRVLGRHGVRRPDTDRVVPMLLLLPTPLVPMWSRPPCCSQPPKRPGRRRRSAGARWSSATRGSLSQAGARQAFDAQLPGSATGRCTRSARRPARRRHGGDLAAVRYSGSHAEGVCCGRCGWSSGSTCSCLRSGSSLSPPRDAPVAALLVLPSRSCACSARARGQHAARPRAQPRLPRPRCCCATCSRRD